MTWTFGSDLYTDSVEWLYNDHTDGARDTNQPYTLDVEFHIALSIDPGAGKNDSTTMTWYSAPASSPLLGPARGSDDTDHALSLLSDEEDWLGRTHWTTAGETANASYNEVRIWRGVLSADDLQRLHEAGPDM